MIPQLAAAYLADRHILLTAETDTDAAYARMQSIFSQAERLGLAAELTAAVN